MSQVSANEGQWEYPHQVLSSTSFLSERRHTHRDVVVCQTSTGSLFTDCHTSFSRETDRERERRRDYGGERVQTPPGWVLIDVYIWQSGLSVQRLWSRLLFLLRSHHQPVTKSQCHAVLLFTLIHSLIHRTLTDHGAQNETHDTNYSYNLLKYLYSYKYLQLKTKY